MVPASAALTAALATNCSGSFTDAAKDPTTLEPVAEAVAAVGAGRPVVPLRTDGNNTAAVTVIQVVLLKALVPPVLPEAVDAAGGAGARGDPIGTAGGAGAAGRAGGGPGTGACAGAIARACHGARRG